MVLLHLDRYWDLEGQLVHRHNNLHEVPHPMNLSVKMGQRNHLVLHNHRNHDRRRAAVSGLLRRGWFLEETQEVALPNWRVLLGAILLERDSCD
jgi:hypothetical protein